MVRKVVVGLLGAAMVTSVGVSLPTVAQAAPPVDPVPSAISRGETQVDDLPSPLEDKRRALEAGFDTHWTKPVDPAKLEEI